MTVESIVTGTFPKSPGVKLAPIPAGVKSSFTELDLPGFIGQILSQYESLLVRQVEKDIKSQALAGVKEEANRLHYQALERLRSMESKVQQGVQAVLDRARETIFEMVREEVESIFDQLGSRLEDVLAHAEVEADPIVAEPSEQEGEAREDRPEEEEATASEEPAQSEAEAAAEAKLVANHQEVCLELPPPLDLKPLLGFYRGLSETRDVTVLRTLGSLDKGVSLFIRPTKPDSVSNLLRTLPGVQDVREATFPLDAEDGEGTGACPKLQIVLIPTAE